jgi:hypothetical protein
MKDLDVEKLVPEAPEAQAPVEVKEVLEVEKQPVITQQEEVEVETMQVEIPRTLYGDVSWAFVTHIGTIINPNTIRDIAQGELGADSMNGPEVLWSLFQHGILSNYADLEQLLMHYQTAGLLFGVSKDVTIPYRGMENPSTALPGKSLGFVVANINCGLTLSQLREMFGLISQSARSLANLRGCGNTTSIWVVMRKLFESGQIRRLEDIIALLDVIQKGGFEYDFRRIAARGQQPEAVQPQLVPPSQPQPSAEQFDAPKSTRTFGNIGAYIKSAQSVQIDQQNGASKISVPGQPQPSAGAYSQPAQPSVQVGAPKSTRTFGSIGTYIDSAGSVHIKQ